MASIPMSLYPFLVSIMLLFSNALLPLLPLFSGKHSVLSLAPNHLRYDHVILIISLLLAKPWLRYLRLVPSLQRNPETETSGIGNATQAGFNLPSLMVSVPLKLGWSDLDHYQKALRGPEIPEQCGMPKSALFVLAGVTTPLMSLLLAKRTCPILPLGSVNVRNRFEFLRPEECKQAILGDIKISQVTGRLAPDGRRVKRGVELDVAVEVWAVDSDGDESTVIFRQVITILQFLKRSVEPRFVEVQQETTQVLEREEQRSNSNPAKLYIESDAPTRWALVCKDYNPIHISSLTAKMFGFPGKIAHGNLVVARTVEQLSADGGLFGEICATNDKPWWMEVHFRRPIVVPMELEIESGQAKLSYTRRADFQVVYQAKTYIEGSAGWF